VSSVVKEAAFMIRSASCAVALTGAGISVASGIPDFRSPGGLWARYDPQKVASIEALHKNPAAVWKFLDETAAYVVKAEPNNAHFALAEMESSGFLQAVITQNIDGLHQRSGSSNVIEFHGNCSDFYCMKCGEPFHYNALKRKGKGLEPPRCTSCGGLIRPDLVFFGERIPEQAMKEGDFYSGGADLAVIVGTSGEVAPANMIPSQIKKNGGKLIEINKNGSAYSSICDLSFDAPAEEVLPLIADELLRKEF
jgi:NAD-dependent deacetylase